MRWMTGLVAITMFGADQTVYIGTRTREGGSQGIYRMTFNSESGELRDVKLAGATPDPSFIAVHPKRALVFAVAARPEGKVRAFAIQADGSLRFLNEVSSKGSGPAHVQVDRSGEWVATANFTSGSAAVYRIGSDGRLAEAADSVQHEGKGDIPRQASPHAHSCQFSADNRTMYVADLGIDEVRVYGFDAKTGKLTPQSPLRTPKRAGPRHMALGKKKIYVVNEISSSVSVFEGGVLKETVNALPDGFTGDSSASEILLDAKEKFLYSSNRGADTIAIFKVGAHLQKIADLKVGKVPRGFVLSPDGRFMLVASQDEDFVQSYRLDAKTGLATAVGKSVKAPFPICLRFANGR